MSHFRSRTRSEFLCGQNYSFTICASKIFAQLLIECHNTNHCHLSNCTFTNDLRICPSHLLPPPLFFPSLFLLLLNLILLLMSTTTVLIIKLKAIHNSSGEFTVYKTSLYAFKKNADCIKKYDLPLITRICLGVFNNTFVKWLDSHHDLIKKNKTAILRDRDLEESVFCRK